MTTDAEDRSTWRRNGQVIRRAELLRLIEENGGPKGLDMRGAIFVGEGPGDHAWKNPIDLSPDALAPLVAAYREANNGADPPWLSTAGGVSLWRAELQGGILWRAGLQGADLMRAQLQGAHLVRAQLQGAHLVRAQLQGADLVHAQLQGADLVHAQLQGADLAAAELQEADLRAAGLERVRMYDVSGLDGAYWYAALLDHTRIKGDSLGKAVGEEIEAHRAKRAEYYHRAKEAYLLLKNNFNQIGRYEDASWAYVKEQRMERMAFYRGWRSHGWRVWRAWGSFWRWLRNWAYELTTEYGENVWRAVRTGLCVIAAFAVGFWATGVMGGRGWGAVLDSIVYSVSTFATFNLGRAGLNPEGRGVEIASSLEAILGIGVLALVVFTLGNRMSRG